MANFWSKLGFGRDKSKEQALHEGVQPAPAAVAAYMAAIKQPPSGEVSDIPVIDQIDWSVKQVRTAVAAYVSGQFGNAGMLADAMMGDDRIQGATNGRTKGITSVDVTITPADRDVDKTLATQIALDIENDWDELLPEPTIEDMIKWQIFTGFALVNLIWEYKDEKYCPRLKLFHPLYIYYNISTRKYTAFTMDGSVEIEPNDPSWFLYTPYGSYRGWMRGAVRSVSIPWLVRQFALRDWARYSEVHGLPQKKAKVPAMAPAEDKRRFFNAVKRLGAESAFLLPQPMNSTSGADWDVELLEAKDTSWEGFDRLIDRCDKSITLCIRGTNLTTEVKTGTGAATKAHQDEDSSYAQADAKKFAMAVRKQVLMLYCLYNYGDPNLAPYPCFDAEPEDNRVKNAAILVSVSKALTSFKTVGWKLDPKKIEEEYGVPVLEVTKPPPAPAVPGQEPPHDEPDGDEDENGNEPADDTDE